MSVHVEEITLVTNESSRSGILFPSVRSGADSFLAQPGRKQATAIKLRIYSTYSPRSSIYLLARCFNICKLLKKKKKIFTSNQISAAAMTSASDEMWRNFNCFSVQGIGGIPTGPHPENKVSDQDIGSPVGQIFWVASAL